MEQMTLFDSFEVHGHTIKNRIVAPPLGEGMAQRDGRVSPAIADYARRVARQGVGTMLLDSAYVMQQGRSHATQLGIATENHLPRLKNVVSALKNYGAFCGIRLSHAGAKTSEALCGEQPVGPGVINFGKDYDASRPFDEDDIKEICLFYAHAVERAEEIGCDFVELNGGQQQLLDQCLHTRYNTREDRFGQTLENRLRLACMIIDAMKSRLKGKILISYYFPIHDKVDDGFSELDLERMLEVLEEAGVDFFHPVTIHVMNKFFGNNSTLLECVTKYTRKPVMVEGNIKSTSVLKEALSLNRATFYCLDKTLFSRTNWDSFLKKKLSS